MSDHPVMVEKSGTNSARMATSEFNFKQPNTVPHRVLQPSSPLTLPEEAEEIKEFHFHIYWITSDRNAHDKAMALRKRILELVDAGFFKVVPLSTVNEIPRGPHPVGSYEVWVPFEYFARFYSWVSLHRTPDVSILIHPLTKEEIKDHTFRATFMGPSMPLNLNALSEKLDHVPLQYPELGLGYSARK
ncbi:hypothetical protein SpCBS45565_g03289 [Spizellomyces sp. 'palustris']|nr:hypothetical protein SpCBS45565_g03289 [Spizellomyces sp. 'palustris']